MFIEPMGNPPGNRNISSTVRDLYWTSEHATLDPRSIYLNPRFLGCQRGGGNWASGNIAEFEVI